MPTPLYFVVAGETSSCLLCRPAPRPLLAALQFGSVQLLSPRRLYALVPYLSRLTILSIPRIGIISQSGR